ncbi:tRNA (guanosine(46)-N7)-methyltransferase TrmB [Piscinibacter sakaiensis]|uniref:tRNA (guanosine(46)-N7)-methyltransferase TrmB n=1 Tax=Piscinibacter sakaiensis TaxID=1547922 RepID=UPI003AAEF15D
MAPAGQPELTTPDKSPPRRGIRSYVVRAGRIGPGQARALQDLAADHLIPYRDQVIDLPAVFGREAPVVLEIGFGMGAATAAIAKARPETNFLGIEVHPPGVGALLQQIAAQQLGNLRLIQHDAVDVIEQMLAPASLAGVHIYFPDPWPKKRHHKRRLIQPPFIERLIGRMAPGAYLHCATDWQPYAEQMLAVLSAQPGLVNEADGYAPRPSWRPLTKFENRGLERGHGVWDLLFRRSS